jgi:hypothetical protein
MPIYQDPASNPCSPATKPSSHRHLEVYHNGLHHQPSALKWLRLHVRHCRLIQQSNYHLPLPKRYHSRTNIQALPRKCLAKNRPSPTSHLGLVLPGLRLAQLGSAQHQLVQIGTSGAEPNHGLPLEQLESSRFGLFPFKGETGECMSTRATPHPQQVLPCQAPILDNRKTYSELDTCTLGLSPSTGMLLRSAAKLWAKQFNVQQILPFLPK